MNSVNRLRNIPYSRGHSWYRFGGGGFGCCCSHGRNHLVNRASAAAAKYGCIFAFLLVIFNTSATGAALTENLYHVPVFLRLDSTDFPRGANFGGADLLAYSARGFELPLEIQAWDSVSRLARSDAWIHLNYRVDSLSITANALRISALLSSNRQSPAPRRQKQSVRTVFLP